MTNYNPYMMSMQAAPPVTLPPAPPLSEKPPYDAYVMARELRGWRRSQQTLSQLNTQLVTLFPATAAPPGAPPTETDVISIRVPAGQVGSIMGTQQVIRGADARTAHALRIRLADSTDTEIDLFTDIRIKKTRTSEDIVQIARVFYADVDLVNMTGATFGVKTDNTWYRFKQGIELNGEERLVISVINPNIDIDVHHIKFALEWDLWVGGW